jgi:hypothetical protein
MLTFIKKYKNIFGIFLMALYVFIATPVSYWHQHSNSVTPRSLSQSKKESASFSSKASDKNEVEENCSICSHQYSAFIDDASFSFTLSFISLASPEASYIQPFHTEPNLDYSNKGPPSNC